MENLSISEIAELCGGKILFGNPAHIALGISTDTRTLHRGEIFLALKGDTFDGHDYIPSAMEKGAAAIIGENSKIHDMPRSLDGNAALIEVGDTLAALHLLAQNYRSKFNISLIAVTGSCGKTTTKDMLASILSESGNTLKTKGNLNNLIGAPLVLLGLDSTMHAAVIEIASNRPGEIRRLSLISNPTAGIITSVGPVHLEGFGSLEGVMKEKCSLAARVSPDGFMVIHHDDIPIDRIRSQFKGKILTFGSTNSADYYATDVRQDLHRGTEFIINGKEPAAIPVPGMHNVLNALAAAAAARELGIDFDRIRKGLAGYSGGKMRMEAVEVCGAIAVNDAYNANPRAMRESISTIMAMPAERRILALGDMLELGEYAEEAHHSLGLYLGQVRPSLVFLLGEFSDAVRKGAVENGMNPEQIHCCDCTEQLAASLRTILQSGDLLLVKGSRGMQMERILDLLGEEK